MRYETIEQRTAKIEGKKFGRLKAFSVCRGRTRLYVLCLCDCGRVTAPTLVDVLEGRVKSCGCLNRQLVIERFTKHGRSKTKAYSSWLCMLRRCCNTSDPKWKYYGGRGITVCDRWKSFDLFFKDMGDCPASFTIDRIDNSMGYFKGNCRWASREEQVRNRGDHIQANINGVIVNVRDECRNRGLTFQTIWKRVRKKGWTWDQALNVPVDKSYRRNFR